jgi:hypothetical protein
MGLRPGVTMRRMRRVRNRLLWLSVVVVVCVGLYFGARALDRALHPDRYRGIDVIAAIHTPDGWDASGGGTDPNDQYFPANSRQPPFTVPYNTWTRRYWAANWSLDRSFTAFDAAARAAGWQPGDCPSTAGRGPTKIHECWQRPDFVLTADFESTAQSCNPETHNCGTTIDVELAERTA